MVCIHGTVMTVRWYAGVVLLSLLYVSHLVAAVRLCLHQHLQTSKWTSLCCLGLSRTLSVQGDHHVPHTPLASAASYHQQRSTKVAALGDTEAKDLAPLAAKAKRHGLAAGHRVLPGPAAAAADDAGAAAEVEAEGAEEVDADAAAPGPDASVMSQEPPHTSPAEHTTLAERPPQPQQGSGDGRTAATSDGTVWDHVGEATAVHHTIQEDNALEQDTQDATHEGEGLGAASRGNALMSGEQSADHPYAATVGAEQMRNQAVPRPSASAAESLELEDDLDDQDLTKQTPRAGKRRRVVLDDD